MSVAVAESAKPRVVLIDLSSIYHPAWRFAEGQAQSMAIAATLDMVTRCAKKDPNALVAICLDSRKSWRKDLVPTYKAQREKLPNDFYGTLDRVKERLVADGYLLWEAEGFEADDVIATATEEAVRRGHDVAICSADKDLMQLLRPGVKQFRTHDQSLWTEKEAEAKFGVKCSQLGDWLALVGDPSDNIKGCQGVGEKRATQMLQTNGDWAGIEKAAQEKQFTASITTALANFDYATTRKLVDLVRTVPIKFDEIYQRREQKPLTHFEDEPMNDVSKDSAPVESDEAVGAADLSGTKESTPVAPTADELPPPIALPAELVEYKPKADRRLVPVSAQFERQLEPGDASEALWMAKGFHNSRLCTKFSSTPAIWYAIIRGREMGFSAATSMDLFHFLEDSGKLTLTSNAKYTLALKLPECEYMRCVESTDKTATWETKHRAHPEPRRYTYTIEDAVQAGIATLEPVPRTSKPGEKDRRNQWDKRRRNMISKTCRDQLINEVYPSAAALYSAEELGAEIDD